MPAVRDTHAAIWYLLESSNLPQSVYALIDGAAANGTPAYLSAVSLVEIAYLAERRRIAADAFSRFSDELARDTPAFRVASLDFHVASVVGRIPRDSVPDMPDRIIAATALHLGLPLVTRDRPLRSAGIQTIW